ncbi:serine/threonine-protein kinase [Amycolatopsis sp. 195334CR]|uniref:serine/threonine-protein kinase n=1 Tax=Amycolatopsis sp. 195334CR TaxID=2814588 RepID=UPI001A8F1A1A|nr:serine/threonine-protein kinase [Amycolatopsis sp. 195334CR]MBN6037441.1 serine/threonine protein kinase [Amycolatopsis sp. 195334CR]
MREGELVAGRYRLPERVGADQEFATGLRHPNVVAQYESVTEHGDRWLVMEYVPSRNLAEVLREDGPLPPRDAARIGAHLTDALDAVHRAGVVHRDVTPGNTLIADDGTVKLTDFGISRPLWNEVTMTQGSLVPGTRVISRRRSPTVPTRRGLRTCFPWGCCFSARWKGVRRSVTPNTRWSSSAARRPGRWDGRNTPVRSRRC